MPLPKKVFLPSWVWLRGNTRALIWKTSLLICFESWQVIPYSLRQGKKKQSSKAATFRHFDLFPVPPPKKFQVQMKISTTISFPPDDLSVSYDYELRNMISLRKIWYVTRLKIWYNLLTTNVSPRNLSFAQEFQKKFHIKISQYKLTKWFFSWHKFIRKVITQIYKKCNFIKKKHTPFLWSNTSVGNAIFMKKWL